MRVKISYGICLCRRGDNGTEIIMIKKRLTYAFVAFVNGSYRSNDERYLTRLFNDMTDTEKLLILSQDFRYLWKHVWFRDPPEEKLDSALCQRHSCDAFPDSKYWDKHYKFSLLTKDNKKKIKRLMYRSSNAETLWEFPKGRKHTKETDLDAAIREFCEETGIRMAKFIILWDAPRVTQSYVDGGTKYINYYYLAECKGNIVPAINFGNTNQISETRAIKWVKYTDIDYMTTDEKTNKRIKKFFKKISHLYKLHRKLDYIQGEARPNQM